MKKAIVISASSDIGAALCKDWTQKGWQVFGTYRRHTERLQELEEDGSARFVFADLSSKESVKEAIAELRHLCPSWDVLVLAAGNLEPVGLFEEVDFDAWETGIQINLLAGLRFLHGLLPYRNQGGEAPSVLLFAGGGSNGAVLNYSSYTLSKIALTKMCELLDAEIPDVRFTIIGPGWVKTKIHEATLMAGAHAAGKNYEQTLHKLGSDEWTPMEDVINCCNWLITTPTRSISGRNVSVVYDAWGSKELESALEKDTHLYKLRRFGNHLVFEK